MHLAVNFDRYRISQYINTKHEPQSLLKNSSSKGDCNFIKMWLSLSSNIKGCVNPITASAQESPLSLSSTVLFGTCFQELCQHWWRSLTLEMKQPYNKRDYTTYYAIEVSSAWSGPWCGSAENIQTIFLLQKLAHGGDCMLCVDLQMGIGNLLLNCGENVDIWVLCQALSCKFLKTG